MVTELCNFFLKSFFVIAFCYYGFLVVRAENPNVSLVQSSDPSVVQTASIGTSASIPTQLTDLGQIQIPQTSLTTTMTPLQESSKISEPSSEQQTTQVFAGPANVSVESGVEGEFLRPKDSKDVDDSGQEADLYLNFNNASLASVVNYLGEQKKINIIPHKDLATLTVTLSTRVPLTLNRAWNVLLTLLEMNGFSMIKVKEVYRIVLSRENKFEPLPVYSAGTGTEPENLPESDKVVRYVYFFKNIKAELARDILSSMLDREGILISTDLNACIMKEKCFNIKAAMKIVKELDQGGLSEQIKIIPLKYANAETVERLFQEILQVAGREERVIRFTEREVKKEQAYFSTTTKIFAEITKNALILLGTQKNLDRITDFIYKYIDVPIGEAESRLHIKEIKYAKAEDLKPILEDIIKPPRGQAAEKSVLVGEYKFFEDVIIAAERLGEEGQGLRGGGNRLIISCNRDDWRRLSKLIDKLDKPEPQIALEVMVINTQIDESKQLGAQHYGIFGHQPGMGLSNLEFYNLSSERTQNGDGQTESATDYIQLATQQYEGQGHPAFVTVGRAARFKDDPQENIWTIIKAIVDINNSNIILQPFLVANNNQECKVEVTKTARVYGELDSKKGEPSWRKIIDMPAVIQATIKPRINLNGVVDLDINIEVSEFEDTSQDKAKKTNRVLKTKSTMLAGEVLILGGLMKKKDTEEVFKTPILGDLPIIGSLFKNKQKVRSETDLYIFIRPSIIKPRFEGSADEYTQLKLDYAKYQLLKGDTYVRDKDPIQRWFFKPADQSIKQKISDFKSGIIRPLDNFVFAKSMPRLVNIKADSYYKVSEELAKYEEKSKKSKDSDLIQAGTVKLN